MIIIDIDSSVLLLAILPLAAVLPLATLATLALASLPLASLPPLAPLLLLSSATTGLSLARLPLATLTTLSTAGLLRHILFVVSALHTGVVLDDGEGLLLFGRLSIDPIFEVGNYVIVDLNLTLLTSVLRAISRGLEEGKGISNCGPSSSI